ncbi:glycosyltransferase family 2 protein [Neobacillus driksii]|uniref:glycosyltransferase family 2 protein n=1 Tax=Neobacillus driksii TaxID=3035913 RepID=UPI0035BBE994
MMVPKVSVIIPVYNCEKYLSNCLDSIIAQTYTNLEIIIVNDGSMDGSELIINKYKEAHKEIKYFYQENRGPSEARNIAITNATGEYLVFIDSDDTVEKNYIESLYNKIVSSGSDLVCCGYKDISRFGLVNHSDFIFENTIPLHSFIEMVCNGTGGVLWSKIFKKEIIKMYNLQMDKNLFMSEDLIFVLRYATHCKSFAAIKEYSYNYNRLNDSSISSNISIRYLPNYIRVCETLEEVLNSIDLDKNKIKKIITERIQEIVLIGVEQQSINLKVLGMENAVQNVINLLSENYIQEYIDHFSSQNVFYKPYVFLLKKKLVKSSILYGVYLNTLRSLKRNVKKLLPEFQGVKL